MLYATEFVFRDSIVHNDLMFLTGDKVQHANSAALRVRELSTQSASEDSRLFRIEATLAARHHESLRNSLKDLFQQSVRQVIGGTEKTKASQNEVRSVWIGVRTSGFGRIVLGVLAPQFKDVNWMSTAHAAATVVREHAMKHYVGDVSQGMVS